MKENSVGALCLGGPAFSASASSARGGCEAAKANRACLFRSHDQGWSADICCGFTVRCLENYSQTGRTMQHNPHTACLSMITVTSIDVLYKRVESSQRFRRRARLQTIIHMLTRNWSPSVRLPKSIKTTLSSLSAAQ